MLTGIWDIRDRAEVMAPLLREDGAAGYLKALNSLPMQLRARYERAMETTQRILHWQKVARANG